MQVVGAKVSLCRCPSPGLLVEEPCWCSRGCRATVPATSSSPLGGLNYKTSESWGRGSYRTSESWQAGKLQNL